MKERRSAKKVKHVAAIDVVINLLKRIQDFRHVHNIKEGGFWDLMHIYFYYVATGKGISAYQLTRSRYRIQTGAQAIKERRAILIDRGLVFHISGRTYLTQLGLSEIEKLLTLIPDSIIRSIVEQENKVHKNKAA